MIRNSPSQVCADEETVQLEFIQSRKASRTSRQCGMIQSTFQTRRSIFGGRDTEMLQIHVLEELRVQALDEISIGWYCVDLPASPVFASTQ